ncbi:uncharacterized protein SETTUDRAFT_169011 [Exserohilum turcica Et28A]|uniref:Uncharacterized protein n=1 Tax=Exserohilum turcicum (strain 28A) TaxID=671987 RepID=R0KHT7_EXST2|nr:uncharacterized protein SETTUDRAFT_169011 [Exserohilum turcica Et28A]EOA87592.1 hypothetical protein SETTUDRAFT_169011 [Exserohilum turcica Et28A]
MGVWAYGGTWRMGVRGTRTPGRESTRKRWESAVRAEWWPLRLSTRRPTKAAIGNTAAGEGKRP